MQGTATLSPSGNILTISQLGAGELVLQISGNSMFCPLVLEIPVPTPTVPCASISGVVYADVDGGCIFGGPDVGMPHRVLILQPGDHYGLTDETGEYSIGIPYGSYTLDQGFEDFLPLCVDPFPAPFTVSQGASNAVLDLPESNMLGSDVSAFLNTNAHRPGEIAVYTVIARNNSAEDLLNVTVGLEYDAILSFVSSTAPSVTNDPGLIEWNVPVLAPFEAYTVQVQLQVPDDPELEGVFVEGRANVNLGIPDAVPENDSYQANAMIADNYEPQDKRSITSSRTSESIYFLNDDEYVDHTVRFQNTGVSTALFVFVVDTIKPLFDLSTLEILGASHSFKAVLNEGRELRFDMDNIMLPDSASDEPGSHGFVSFRLHPVVGVLPGDVLKNQAHVRFPSQQAFVTNETGLLVETSVGMNNTAPNRPEIYPNPVSDILFIRAAHNGSYMLDVFTVDGRWARSEQGGGSTMSMDVSDLAPGVYVLRFSNPDGSTSTVPFVKDQY